MRVAAVQFKGRRGEIERSQIEVVKLIREGLNWGAKIIVAPELACSEYLFDSIEDAALFAENEEGPLAQKLIPLAQEHQAWIVIGFIECTETQSILYNSALLISPRGEVSVYRKRLLYERDLSWATAGEGVNAYPLPLEQRQERALINTEDPTAPYPLFEVEGKRCTVGICMDLNDHRFTDFCAHAQIDLIAFPTNWLDQGESIYSYWVYVLQRAPQAILIAANSYGSEGDIQFRGESAILQIDPPTLLNFAHSEGDMVIGVDLL